MATHGTEREERRHHDYIRSEIIGHGERLRTVEAQLAETSRRLKWLEDQLTKGAHPGHSGPNDHQGG